MTGLNLSAVLSSISTILVQFAFSSEKAVPRWLRSEPKETVKQKEERASQTGGIELIKKSEMISVSSILFQLEKAGFYLADGYSKELFKEQFGTYFVARFTFTRQKPKYDDVKFARRSLEDLSERAFWSTKAFLNLSSEEDEKESFLSINMTGRKPLYQGDGKLVRIWKTDKEGNRVGNEAKPIAPSGRLILTREGSLRIVSA